MLDAQLLPMAHAQDTLLPRMNMGEHHHSLVLNTPPIQTHVRAAQHSPEGLWRLSATAPATAALFVASPQQGAVISVSHRE